MFLQERNNENIHLSSYYFVDPLCRPPPSQYSFPPFQRESLTCSEAERSSLSPCGHLAAALHLLSVITAAEKKRAEKVSHESSSGRACECFVCVGALVGSRAEDAAARTRRAADSSTTRPLVLCSRRTRPTRGSRSSKVSESRRRRRRQNCTSALFHRGPLPS